MHVGKWNLICHQGADQDQKLKYYLDRTNDPVTQMRRLKYKRRIRTAAIKNVHCPVEIYVSHIVKFPNFSVPDFGYQNNSIPGDSMRKVVKKRIVKAYQLKPNKLCKEFWYYVKLPYPECHEGHNVPIQVSKIFFIFDTLYIFHRKWNNKRKLIQNIVLWQLD